MMIGLLLVAAASQLDGFDAANLALTQCAYETFRAASAENLSVAEFERSLAATCDRDISALRREMVAIQRSRGESDARASTFADRQLARFNADFRRQYERRGEDQEKLETLERALREEDR